jgi:phospholipase D1/2
LIDRWCQQNHGKRECLYRLSEDEFNWDSPGPATAEQGGPWAVQIFRSITSDSAVMSQDRLYCLHRKYGAFVDNSIQRQYIHLIRNAQSFIYIENQYFLGSAFAWLRDTDTICHHAVPIELTEKIISKIMAGERFHVYVTIPMYPEGDPASTPSQEILRWQSRTMECMYKRIYRALELVGSSQHPTDYLSFYCLGKRESPDEVPDDLADPAPGSGAEQVRVTLRHPIYVHSKASAVPFQ